MTTASWLPRCGRAANDPTPDVHVVDASHVEFVVANSALSDAYDDAARAVASISQLPAVRHELTQPTH